MAYTLAGADCIDVAADPAVVSAANEAIGAALDRLRDGSSGSSLGKWKPLLMVSVNDAEDPHFRKADFPAKACPPECHRPCEAVCPANAIALSGVMAARCYGCGRCLSVCPIQHISACSYVSTPQTIMPLVLEQGVDAIEIHTQAGHLEDFRRLWNSIKPWVENLKLVAISCPDADNLIDYLQTVYSIITPLHCPLIWQADGRPMSGDLGIGTTGASIKLGQKVLSSGLDGYVQLAGGTNHHTVPKLRSLNLLNPNSFSYCKTLHASSSQTSVGFPFLDNTLSYFAGVAYGGHARTLLSPILEQLEIFEMNAGKPIPLETLPDLLHQAHHLAYSLVSQLKPFPLML